MYKFSTNNKGIKEKDARILNELNEKHTKGRLIDYLLDRNQDSGYEIIGKLEPAKRNLELFPVIKEMNAWQIPYTNYFEIFPHNTWSISHYNSWIIKSMDNRSAHTTFYKALTLINKNQEISKII
ncbi:hypothetical protein RCL_jg1971.t1 [Rhizophagus clarus]|uniref:Uncharacterized protein n=1 Tax=Rhizophagus clarus TaxID=94130 RepID=A0A8H3M4B5_9GLOM|nr:hypothetical protein RCL_jg1971.t1 [Rhizophagus clarus]